MEIRAYTPADVETIRSWLVLRGLKPKHELKFPPIGLIVDDVAAGFLVKTDARYAMLEYFVCNPYASREDKNNAFHEIIRNLTLEAKRSGYDDLLGITSNHTLIKITLENGFTQAADLTVVRKEI